MDPAWIGVTGTALGAVIGAGFTLLVDFREQQRAPRLAVLDQRIAAHQEVYTRVYGLAEAVHRALRGGSADFLGPYAEFKQAIFGRRFYLDSKSREAVGALYNAMQPVLDGTEDLQLDQFQGLVNEAASALHRGIGLRYE